ncbi:MAG: ATP-binding cassette domain-containing protein [Lachnospiraceae bacterium]|nr:ATP-binding cassette domain-containing protein [Lachnospiraceae bacterium]
MLRLENIKKDYVAGESTVSALKGVSVAFRENEFVSILGPSGCGKTTLLNIIGGLDKYTSGDLIINGVSTKKYKDRDWDSYRNHSIGFVFQSYNLIPHQNVLSNVELALTLSGVSKKERKRRAKEALEKVGLGDQIKKKPNQLSGGQMQRVAIARALVNNPDILLADEPTGALDTETSEQVMDILSEVASDRLVIMVTHNPELAQVYSTRIIRLLDGLIISDTMPVGEDELNDEDGALSGEAVKDTYTADVNSAYDKNISTPKLWENNIYREEHPEEFTVEYNGIEETTSENAGNDLEIGSNAEYDGFTEIRNETNGSTDENTYTNESEQSEEEKDADRVGQSKEENDINRDDRKKEEDKNDEQVRSNDTTVTEKKEEQKKEEQKITSSVPDPEPKMDPDIERAVAQFERAKTRAHQYADEMKKAADKMSESAKQAVKTAFTKSEKKDAAQKEKLAKTALKESNKAASAAEKADAVFEKELKKAEKKYGKKAYPERAENEKEAAKDKADKEKAVKEKAAKDQAAKDQAVKDKNDSNNIKNEKQDKEKRNDKKAVSDKKANSVNTENKKAEEQSKSNTKTDSKKAAKKKRPPRTYMKLHTALSLSLNNLMTKKGRTFLTAFAGSIGIIGISLILSLANGVQEYINTVEEDTLSSYPVSIEQATVDLTSVLTSMQKETSNVTEHEEGRIYTNQIMTSMMKMMINEVSTNNLKDFKKFIEDNKDRFENLTSDISYLYSTQMNLYRSDIENGIYQVSPSQVFASIGMRGMGRSAFMNTDVFQRLIDNQELLNEQYSVVAGRFPEKYDEVVLIVSNNYEAVDYTFYTLGVLDNNELAETFKKLYAGEDAELPSTRSYTYDELMNVSFKLMLNSDYFEKQSDGTWADKSDDEVYLMKKLADAHEVKIVGILKSESKAAMNNLSGIIGYRTDLMDYLINEVNASEIVKDQKEHSDIDIFTGIAFDTGEEEKEELTMEMLQAYISALPADQQASYVQSIQQMKDYGMDEKRILETFSSMMQQQTTDATYDGNLRKLGVSDLAEPTTINIYPKDFASKDSIMSLVDEYNSNLPEDEKIKVSDYIGLILSSVTTIINAISYILIAFVSISLIVSSIMIGIITYISVLERTKEIGILRAVGASKKDISRVFNAETLIVGFTAGLLGIVIAELMLIPINAIILKLTDIEGLAVMPPIAAGILVLISMALTFIAGLFPSRIAARKDPVVALRTE